MCGIAGIYSAHLNKIAAEEQTGIMTTALRHRGPDGEGFYSDDYVALGHRRLSIIDLEGGDQPIFNEDQSIVIVFNGEIYNYLEIRSDLKKKGHIFRTDSDTEVIVHLYEEEGVNCLQRLNGMFAFALWDSNSKSLIIARDRMGEKPLYYTQQNGHFYFASELKSLLVHKELNKRIDLKAVDDYLAYGYVPSNESIIEGISKLAAGHFLKISEKGLEVKPYWRINFSNGHCDLPEVEVLDQLRELINDSIKIRLRSDVPVGAFLSGGIDSSLIVSHAATQSAQKISTFSVGFSERDFDELEYAREIAERYDTEHHEFVLDEIDADLFPKMVAHFDEPFADPSALPTYYVTREAAKKVKVVLSGDGGDELFCGYGRYRSRPFENFVNTLPLMARNKIFGGLSAALPDHISGKGWLSRMSVADGEQWQRTIGIFDCVERQKLWKPELRGAIDFKTNLFTPYFQDQHLDNTSKRMLADQNTYLCDDILVKVDRDSMWHSLEVRVPLLDHRIVEFANNLPLSFKYRDGQLKYPLKKLIEGKVSRKIIERRKTGFGIPIKHWLKGQFYSYSRDILLSSDSRLHAYFEKSVIENLIRGHQKGPRDLSRRIWSLMWFEQWLRNVY